MCSFLISAASCEYMIIQYNTCEYWSVSLSILWSISAVDDGGTLQLESLGRFDLFAFHPELCQASVCVYRKHLKIKCIHCSIMLNRSSEAQACCQVEPNIWYGLKSFPCSSPISPQTHCLFHESSERCECSVLTRPECQALATTESGDTRRADIVTHCRTKSTSHLPESTQYFQCKQCDKVQTCPGIAFEPCQGLRKIYRNLCTMQVHGMTLERWSKHGATCRSRQPLKARRMRGRFDLQGETSFKHSLIMYYIGYIHVLGRTHPYWSIWTYVISIWAPIWFRVYCMLSLPELCLDPSRSTRLGALVQASRFKFEAPQQKPIYMTRSFI